jgi:thiamine monophosphate synthase
MEQPKEKALTREEKVKLFLEKYEKLCKEYDCQFVVTPAYKLSQDTGAWVTVLQPSVGQLSKEK